MKAAISQKPYTASIGEVPDLQVEAGDVFIFPGQMRRDFQVDRLDLLRNGCVGRAAGSQNSRRPRRPGGEGSSALVIGAGTMGLLKESHCFS